MRIINWSEFLLPYEQTVKELTLKIENIAKQYNIIYKNSPIVQVESRVKSVGSIIAKINKKNISLDEIEDLIYDIAGIRIICRFVEDIEKIVKMLKERECFDLKVIEEKDYISNTKESGYRSYHMTVEYPIMDLHSKKIMKAEIQIRTMSMNFWATIEHSLKYKYNGKLPEIVKERLISSAEAAFKLDTEMSTIREEITEAQKIVVIIDKTVEEILDNFHNLYHLAKIDQVNELNKEFIEIYNRGNVEELLVFADKIRVMGDLYRVRYVKE